MPSDILLWTKAEPFRPFRITMNAGRAYEVRHPELAIVYRDSVVINTPSAEEGVAERGQMIGLNLIDRIEAIEAPPAPPEEKPAGKGKKK